MIQRSLFGALALALCMGSAQLARADATKPAVKSHKVIFQVSDADPKKWNLALNNIKNVQEDLGKDRVQAELVAYGPGIGMLKLDSEVATRVAAAIASGVRVVACENTMTNQKLSKGDMLGDIGYVKSGVVELIEKQHKGYAYIRP